MRRIISLVLIFAVLLSSNVVLAQTTTGQIFDTANLTKGVIGLNYAVSDKKTKFMVEKNGVKYIYDVFSEKETQKFPLQLGNGDYKVSVLENTSGNKYKYVLQQTVSVEVKNNNDVFLNSVQNINWNEEMEAIKKAKELTKKAKTDEEKVKILYDYIVKNVSYDYEKVKNLTPTYLPNINDIYATNKGICYDYSSMFAAMLRSVGVPTKLIMGNTTYVKEYHAWNEVYLADQDKWVTIDTTVDAALKKSKKKVEMYKDKKDYTTSKEY